DGLLLLTQSLQLTLRHLLRTLRTDDLDAPWSVLDTALHGALTHLRGSPAHDAEVDKILLSLPARFGGCAVPAFALLAPHARAAMLAESDHELRSRQLLRPAPASAPAPHSLAAGLAGAAPSPYPVLPGVATPVATPEPPTADAADEERGPRQSVRLKQLWAGMMASLVVSLDGRPPRLSLAQCVSLLCHGSPLGRRWMTALPYDLNSTLSDREVQVGLQLRTLLPAPRGRCQTCGKRAPHGHDDICQLAPFRRIARHNRATKLHENELKRVEDTSVVREPRLIGDAHRTDLRVSGKGAPLGVLTEFDFTIISTASVDASKTVWTTGKRLEKEGKGLWLRAQAALTA
ncbi:hypothetical protein OC834_007998, partial [Tilletia horrida]